MTKLLIFLIVPLVAVDVWAQAPQSDNGVVTGTEQADRKFLAALEQRSNEVAPVAPEPPPRVAPEAPRVVVESPIPLAVEPLAPIVAEPPAPVAPEPKIRPISRSEPDAISPSIKKKAPTKRQASVRKVRPPKSDEPTIRRAIAVVRQPAPIAELRDPRDRPVLRPFESSSRIRRSARVTTTTVSPRADRDDDDEDDEDEDEDDD